MSLRAFKAIVSLFFDVCLPSSYCLSAPSNLVDQRPPFSGMFLQLISATDRPRQSTDHPIRFISRRQPNILKFKIKTGNTFSLCYPDYLNSGFFRPTIFCHIWLNQISLSIYMSCSCIIWKNINGLNLFGLGPEFGSADGRSKKYSHFLFHPVWPLALSFIQPSFFLPPSAVNIHFRR